METPFVDMDRSRSGGSAASRGILQSSLSDVITSPITAQLVQQQARNLAQQRIDSEAAMYREKRWQKKVTIVVAIVALSAFFCGILAMWLEASLVAYLAFAFPVVTGPYVVHQRRKLNKLPRLCYVLNQVRGEVNRLMLANDKLHAENNRLAGQLQRLNEAERTLSQFAQQSGSDVRTICDLARENAATLREMKVRTVASTAVVHVYACILFYVLASLALFFGFQRLLSQILIYIISLLLFAAFYLFH